MNTAYLVAGLAYGDEGKGATTDFLCRSRPVSHVVRYNGGPQAAHNVIAPKGKHHTFAQFGSGTLVPDVQTYLSKYMLVNPFSMLREEEGLRHLGITDAWKRLWIDYRCPIVTPFHRELNLFNQRMRGVNTSCCMGIGECRADHLSNRNKVLFAGDFYNPDLVLEKLKFLQELAAKKIELYGGLVRSGLFKSDLEDILKPSYPSELAYRYFAFMEAYRPNINLIGPLHVMGGATNLVFEGAQGVLLDEKHGEEGFNTWTNTTFDNAYSILEDMRWHGNIMRIGVLRTYGTRHGDGPFIGEWKDKVIRDYDLEERHNTDAGYAGRFRIGDFSMLNVKRGIKILGGIDYFALNHLDKFPEFDIANLEFETNTRVLIEGHGPRAMNRKWRNVA